MHLASGHQLYSCKRAIDGEVKERHINLRKVHINVMAASDTGDCLSINYR